MGKVIQIMYTHVSKCKNDTCVARLGNQKRRTEREQEG
jgi:hypothetical protein